MYGELRLTSPTSSSVESSCWHLWELDQDLTRMLGAQRGRRVLSSCWDLSQRAGRNLASPLGCKAAAASSLCPSGFALFHKPSKKRLPVIWALELSTSVLFSSNWVILQWLCRQGIMSGRSQKIPFTFVLICLAGEDTSELERKTGRGSGFKRPFT